MKKPKTLGTAPTKAPEEWIAEKDEAKFKENQDIARRLRTVNAEAREAADKMARLERELGLFKVLDGAKAKPPEWATPSSPSKGHHAIPTLVIADVHRGERVVPAQVEGLNCYNLTIADQRIKRAFDGAIVLARDYMKGVTYDGFVLALPGDMVSGDVQQGRETNVATIADSVVGLVEPLEAGINLAAKEFGKVLVVGVPGNHARNTLKPIAKNRAQDNWDYLAYRIIERDYRNNPNVTVQVGEAADAPFNVYGTKYVLTHGDQFHGGSGISGALAPLLLGAHRKTRRAATAGRPYDSLVMGRFHQAIWYPSKGIIVSGCVVGYNEYAYISNFEPEPPQCALWLTTPKRGITVSAPVYVQDRAAEGW